MTTALKKKPGKSTATRQRTNRARRAEAVVDNGGAVRKRPETAIACCVTGELTRYFNLLDGQPPADLYRMVIRQAEHALLDTVMRESGGNQTKAAQWLGISRGNLRNKLADMDSN